MGGFRMLTNLSDSRPACSRYGQKGSRDTTWESWLPRQCEGTPLPYDVWSSSIPAELPFGVRIIQCRLKGII